MIGQHVGAPRHMLAAAKTVLEMERTVAAEKPCGGHLALGRNRDLRQHGIDQILLPRAQRLALRSAVEAVEGGRVAGFMRRHGARVSAAGRGGQGPPALTSPARGDHKGVVYGKRGSVRVDMGWG